MSPTDGSSARGLSLHIGLNKIDPDHYGSSGQLFGCHADAQDMAALAQAQGFERSDILLDEQATRATVKAAIEAAAAELTAGDLFLLTYSGHGSQVPDRNQDELEIQPFDFKDETWCLFDAQLIDDELYALWGRFGPGVRILLLSDSCHSGTIAKELPEDMRVILESNVIDGRRYRFLPPRFQSAAYLKNKAFYKEIGDQPSGDSGAIQASLCLISGCQDDQLSEDGIGNGLFTGRLLAVWDDGDFDGDLFNMHSAIRAQMPPDQQPNLMRLGPDADAMAGQRPFSITEQASAATAGPGTAPPLPWWEAVSVDAVELAAMGVLDELDGAASRVLSDATVHTLPGDVTEPVRLPTLTPGLADPRFEPFVTAVQTALKLAGLSDQPPSGTYDPATVDAVKAFQAAEGLRPDGTFTEDDWIVLLGLLPEEIDDPAALFPYRWSSRALSTDGPPPLLRRGAKGPVVAALQLLLGLSGFPTGIDGDFGFKTDTSVRHFQSAVGLSVDGVVGRNSWGALLAGFDEPDLTDAAVDTVVRACLIALGIHGATDGDLGAVVLAAQVELELVQTGQLDAGTLSALLVHLGEDGERRDLRALVRSEVAALDDDLRPRVQAVLEQAVDVLGAREWDAQVLDIIEGYFSSQTAWEQRHWCALAVSHWLRQGLELTHWAALPYGRRMAAVKQIAWWARQAGLLEPVSSSTTVVPGSLFVMPRGGNTHDKLARGIGSGHVGLVVADLGAKVVTIEGNTSDAVHQRQRTKSSLTGVIRWWREPDA